jgi:hypothetical protein
VDGQPIDAVNTPQTATTTPQISGRINTGAPAIEIGIGNGEITRFTLEADGRGRFKGRPPAPLAPGEYGLYLFDTLVGNFVVTGDDSETGESTRNRDRSPVSDVARIVPFPGDFLGLYPGLGQLDGRFYTIDQEALRIAAASGDVTEESIAASRQQLRDAGWQQRYESRLAIPDPNDPERFSVQVTSFVIEYRDSERAQAAFFASLTGQDLRPDVIVGQQSELTALSGTTPDTGVTYQALRNIFHQDRFVGFSILAELGGADPNQDALILATQATAARAAQVAAGEVSGSAPKALRLELPADAVAIIDEAYQAIDGELVPLYNEPQTSQAAREAIFTGTYEDFVGSVTGTAGTRGGAAPFVYSTTILAFPDEEEADGWLAGLPSLIANDPLAGYVAFDPVADAPIFGEGSSVFRVERLAGEAAVSGFRVYVRVGTDIATLEYAADPAPTLSDLQPLIDAQVACLEAGGCSGPAPLPGGRAERDRQGDSRPATPEPGSTGGGVADVSERQRAPQPELAEPAEQATEAEELEAEPTEEPARPAATSPAANTSPNTPEPAVRRAGSSGGEQPVAATEAVSTPTATPVNAPAPDPTPTFEGGVRDVTPNPQVTGG